MTATLREIIATAEEEAGARAPEVTTVRALRERILRTRLALLRRVSEAWQGSEYDTLPLLLPTVATAGWGVAWGVAWGAAEVAPAVLLAGWLTIHDVEALRAADATWQRVTLVTEQDQHALQPCATLTGARITPLDYASAWSGVYTSIRVTGVRAPDDPADDLTDLAPNAQLAPAFARALALDAAVFLTKSDPTAARVLRVEQQAAVADLLAHARSQRSVEAQRFTETS